MEDPFQNLFGIAFRLPVANEPLIGEKRIVGGKHYSVLQAPRDLMFEIGCEIFRRPAMQLAPNVALVHKHSDGFGLPGPAGARGYDFQIGIGGGYEVEMAGMAVVQDHATSARKACAKPRSADENQNRDLGLDTEAIIRIEQRIAGWRSERTRHAETEKADALVDAAAQLFQPVCTGPWIDVNPMA